MGLGARAGVVLAVLVLLAVIPPLALALDQPFYLLFFRRMMILAIGALSLNLIMGYGGMISFGHAVYLGIGAYAVGICAHYEIFDGYTHFALAILVSAAVALLFGVICLRTRGVYFIMITLALAQMMFFLFVSIEEYGADDGLTIFERSHFGNWLDLGDNTVFYYVVFLILLACLGFSHRLVNSRFGMAIQGIKSNEPRMEAIGFPVFRYRLTAFVIAGAMGGLAGALLANHTDFVSPSTMHWVQSGDLIFMILLGGMNSLIGPIIGAVVFLLLEEILAGFTSYWQLIFGPFLVLVVLYARGGLMGLLPDRNRGHG